MLTFVSGLQRRCGRHLPCQEAQALLRGRDLKECSVMSKLMSEFHKIKSKFSNGVKYDNSLEDPEQGSVIHSCIATLLKWVSLRLQGAIFFQMPLSN